MSMTNETITLGNGWGLEIDFSRIVYKDANFNGPNWLVAHIPAADIRRLCGKSANWFTVTEDEVEVALIEWLANEVKGDVVSFRWLWDTYRTAKAA